MWPILIAVGTTSLLEAYTEQLNRLRNEESSRLRGLRSVKRTLDRVGKALGYFPTVGVIADGLLNATQQPFSTIGLVQNLCPCSDHDWRKPLRQQLIDTIGVQATWTIQTEASLRNTLAQFAQVAGISEDIRLQRRLLCLTIVVGIFTAMASLAVIFSPESPFDEAWSIVLKLVAFLGFEPS